MLLDFVLTLFESPSSADLAMQACMSCGLGVTAAEAASIGDSANSAWHAYRVIDHETSVHQYRTAFIKAMKDAGGQVAGLSSALHKAEAEPRNWRPYTDTRDVLQTLVRGGCMVAIVSNFGHDIKPIFAHHGLDKYVSTYAVSCHVGAAKPDSAIFQYALERLGASPQQAAMIGDDPVNDGAARAMGVRTLILPQPQQRVPRLGRVLPFVFSIADGIPNRRVAPRG